jgi:hypothetical protein
MENQYFAWLSTLSGNISSETSIDMWFQGMAFKKKNKIYLKQVCLLNLPEFKILPSNYQAIPCGI